MMDQGVVQEVENLLKSNACGGVLKAIGVKEIAQFLNKELTLEQTKEQILLSTRHYAKRQMTWFRGMERRGFTIHWLDATLPMEEKIEQITKLINTNN